jgi:DnaK suppressor protein
LAQNRNKEKTMIDFQHYSTVISNRLQELGLRLEEIDAELGIPKPADFEEQAIDIEDDEVLESLGVSAQKEVRLLKLALRRIAEKTYGTCLECAQPISKERLDAVPYATEWARFCALPTSCRTDQTVQTRRSCQRSMP